MKRLFTAAGAALTLLLGGCAATVTSDVTTFHQWPAAPADKSYVFEAPPPQDDTLELRSYENLVGGELAKLGFHPAAAGETAALKVAMRFTTTDVPMRVLVPVFPSAAFPFERFHYGFASPYAFYRPAWGGRRYWAGGLYSRFYDPFWADDDFAMVTRHVYQRELQVAIKSASDGKRLFDVTVHNQSHELSTPAMMPALVQSAFLGFPGVSGVARRIELKREG